MNIPAGDDGGELDPHGADGNGNPIGGLVFSDAFGQGTRQIVRIFLLFTCFPRPLRITERIGS
jgi:hypothetical protein